MAGKKAKFRFAVLGVGAATLCGAAQADEGGVSFWLPGQFGNLAAAPAQSGWSGTSIYYFEFDAHDRPHGWNTWLTFSISPAPQARQV